MFQTRAEAFILALPAAVFVAAIFLVPVFILLSEGFQTADGFSLQPYVAFFSDPLNQTVFLRTLKLGALVTLVDVLVEQRLAAKAAGRAAPGRAACRSVPPG